MFNGKINGIRGFITIRFKVIQIYSDLKEKEENSEVSLEQCEIILLMTRGW